jgi:hypothetical protein
LTAVLSIRTARVSREDMQEYRLWKGMSLFFSAI